jgi:hypothetical protein
MVGFDGQLVLSTGEGGQEVPCPGSLASVCVLGVGGCREADHMLTSNDGTRLDDGRDSSLPSARSSRV